MWQMILGVVFFVLVALGFIIFRSIAVPIVLLLVGLIVVGVVVASN